MSKKFKLSNFVLAGLVVLAALLVSGSAFAQGAGLLSRSRDVRPVLGSITALGSHRHFAGTGRAGRQHAAPGE